MDKLSMKVNCSVGGSSNLVDVRAANVNYATDFFAFSQDFSTFGKLPSQPENPKERCNAVTLRSGKVMGEEHEIKVKLKGKKDECESESISTKAKASKESNEEKEDKKKIEETYVPSAPLEDYENVALTEECSAILQNKLPPKLKDPGSFSIPCHIGETSIERALCDLGASVSLVPLSICEKLKVGDLKPTTISLQLADRSIKYPVGILENVPLKVGKFFIPVDFIVLEVEEDVRAHHTWKAIFSHRKS
ncbi:uncharacterized protein LOC131178306 [Hevea brasiliensis]|uniref:uncharacterized protein LOC131178306 n=1 Tax=Hevea brasiliensis TaxID=3981 RepID=UPI0025CCD16E|nr:uncharacterized protein LOC131178306 [Hevea brasiliensis]